MDLFQAGTVVNTHGIHGDIRIKPSTDTPEFLTRFETVFIKDAKGDAINFRVLSARVHKGNVLLRLDGIDSVEAAEAFRGYTVWAEKSEAGLAPDEHFVDDLIGLHAVNDETGETFGEIADFFTLPSNGVYVVRGEREYLIPAVPEFVREIDETGGFVRFRLIEGL